MEAHETALSHDNARLRAENEQLRKRSAAWKGLSRSYWNILWLNGVFDIRHEMYAARATIEQLRRELEMALHDATYMTAKVAEVDTERLALLDELDAARDWVHERRVICDLLSAQPETKAGQTLVEALQTVLAELDAARALIEGLRRTLKGNNNANM